MMRPILALVCMFVLQVGANVFLDMDYRTVGVVLAVTSGMIWNEFGWPTN